MKKENAEGKSQKTMLLEIIKEHFYKIGYSKGKPESDDNEVVILMKNLTEAEFDLLKEAFRNEEE